MGQDGKQGEQNRRDKGDQTWLGVDSSITVFEKRMIQEKI